MENYQFKNNNKKQRNYKLLNCWLRWGDHVIVNPFLLRLH